MAILSIKSCFSFIIFLDPHLIVGTGEVQLGKLLCLLNWLNNLPIRDSRY